MSIWLIKGECLEEMAKLVQMGIKVDAVITDIPYGTTACRWDIVIPFEPMWERINALIKPNAAVVLFGSEPFSSKLRLSNFKNYRYDWIWEKTKAGQFLNAKRRPLEAHEIISVFYQKLPLYIPQKLKGKPYIKKAKTDGDGGCYGKFTRKGETNKNYGERYPRTVIKFANPNNKSLHPMQKPVALMEYLIKTYTNENELLLDFTAGSGTTGVACQNTNRHCICIEQDEKYFKIMNERINGSK